MSRGTASLLRASSPLPALQPWLSRVARELGTRLSVTLERSTKLRVETVSEEHPSTLFSRVEDTGWHGRLAFEPSGQPGLLQMDTELVGFLLGRLLGGSGGGRLCRELTALELDVLAPVSADVLDVLNDNLRGMVADAAELAEVETLTSLARRLVPNESLVVAELLVTPDGAEPGRLRLALATRWAGGLERQLVEPRASAAEGTPLLQVPDLAALPLGVRVETWPVRVPARRLAHLRAGDRLRLGRDPARWLRLRAGGRVVAEGSPTVTGLRKALCVTASGEEDDT